jgi:hypothetical protein
MDDELGGCLVVVSSIARTVNLRETKRDGLLQLLCGILHRL